MSWGREMTSGDDTEQILERLVRDAEEKARKAHEQVDFFRGMLSTYRTAFSQPSGTPSTFVPGAVSSDVDSNLVGKLQGKSYRQMVQLWAEAHGGRIVVKDLVAAAAATGRFDTRTKAHRTLWSTISQAAKRGEIERVDQGVYRTKSASMPPLLPTTDPMEVESRDE
jgi:hypothetical protein